tara:strand:+ start:1839 stop:2372 length:534 start_codon:yes stop_codon:yes gene_type:complete
MAETTIITKDDIRLTWANFDKNLKDTQVDPFILKAQRSDLKPFLGDALYYDFIENLIDANYVDLLDGVVYSYQGNDIYFNGIKPMLAAYSYARTLKNIDINVGRGAVVSKSSEQSDKHENTLIYRRKTEAESEALRLQGELEQFLSTKRSDYPLWKDNNKVKKTSFRILKVTRHRQV